MKIAIQIPVQVDVKYLQVEASIHSWQVGSFMKDDILVEIPFMEDGMWKPKIEIETGRIIGWNKGGAAKIGCVIVSDHCKFTLQDKDEKEIKSIYSPSLDMILKSFPLAFYDISLSVDDNGLIKDWEKLTFLPIEKVEALYCQLVNFT